MRILSSVVLATCFGVSASAQEVDGVPAGGPEVAEAIRQLHRSVADYNDAVKAANKAVAEDLAATFGRAAEKGDIVLARQCKDAQEALRQRGAWPAMELARSAYGSQQAKLRRALSDVERAYDRAAKEVLRTGDLARAEAIQRERQDLAKRVSALKPLPTPTAAVALPTAPTAIAPFDAAKAAEYQRAWAAHLQLPVVSENSVGMRLVVIPPGTCATGARAMVTKIARPFLLGQHEVTHGQWREVMKTEPWKGHGGVGEGDSVAVSMVSWNDATSFCEKLTVIERAGGRIGETQVYRLPSQAEWEYACRAGTHTRFSFGDDISQLGDYAWCGEEVRPSDPAATPRTRPVGLKKPNQWNLFDMHGNVWEWCDGFAQYKQRPGRGGGYWAKDACATGNVGPFKASRRAADHGFRVLLTVVD